MLKRLMRKRNFLLPGVRQVLYKVPILCGHPLSHPTIPRHMPVGVGKKLPHHTPECVFRGAPYVKGLFAVEDSECASLDVDSGADDAIDGDDWGRSGIEPGSNRGKWMNRHCRVSSIQSRILSWLIWSNMERRLSLFGGVPQPGDASCGLGNYG